MRIVIGDDSALVREGIARLLQDDGHEIAAKVGDADALVAAVEEHQPDLVIIDIRMPPDLTDDGARAAIQFRRRDPRLPIMLLSQHIETRHSVDLVTTGNFGYLLKDRIFDVDEFLDAVRRVGAGGTALDPEVITSLLRPPRRGDPLTRLTDREHDVLALIAEGRSNAAIARALVLAERTVEAHVRSILTKLDIYDSKDDHRRVLAVLTYLAAQRDVPTRPPAAAP